MWSQVSNDLFIDSQRQTRNSLLQHKITYQGLEANHYKINDRNAEVKNSLYILEVRDQVVSLQKSISKNNKELIVEKIKVESDLWVEEDY